MKEHLALSVYAASVERSLGDIDAQKATERYLVPCLRHLSTPSNKMGKADTPPASRSILQLDKDSEIQSTHHDSGGMGQTEVRIPRSRKK
jgi:hypothetical protein